MKQARDIAIAGISSILSGLGVLTLVHCKEITFDAKLDIGSVLKCLSTILSAMFITLYVQRIVHGKKKKNELVNEQLGLLIEAVIDIQRFESTEQYGKVVKSVKRVAEKSQFIGKIVRNHGYGSEPVAACHFNDNLSMIRKLLTHTPEVVPVTNNPELVGYPSSCSDDQITWHWKRIEEIDYELEKFKNRIFEAKLAVDLA